MLQQKQIKILNFYKDNIVLKNGLCIPHIMWFYIDLFVWIIYLFFLDIQNITLLDHQIVQHLSQIFQRIYLRHQEFLLRKTDHE